jgi:hypothetical protein
VGTCTIFASADKASLRWRTRDCALQHKPVYMNGMMHRQQNLNTYISVG